MITYVRGDIFTSPASVLVNTVNTAGVMGKGIAKEFKAYFPEMFAVYQEKCESGELTIGALLFHRGVHKSVLNFPTKRHWRQKSRVEDIETGLRAFVNGYEQLSISSIAFPQLGCGNGELDWESQVKPLMERYLGSLPIDIYIHLYDGGSAFIEHRDPVTMKQWLRTQPESMPFAEFWEDVIDFATGDGSWRINPSFLDASQAELSLTRHPESLAVPTDDMRHIWHQLRSFGFLSVEDLPGHLVPLGAELMDLLTHLEYVQPVEYFTQRQVGSEPSTDAGQFRRGIGLVPVIGEPVSSSQLELAGIG